MAQVGGDVTQLLARWADGDRAALDALMPTVYAELRRIADAVAALDSHVVDLIARDGALEQLARVSPRRARIVELCDVGGLTGDEIADLLRVSAPTMSRDQKSAEAWLTHVLSEAR